MKNFRLLLSLGFLSCTGLVQEGPSALLDLLPPRLEDFREVDNGILFLFDEELSGVTWRTEGQDGVDQPGQTDGREVRLNLPEGLIPGSPLRVLLEARDRWGNSNTFLHTLYVPNPRLPRLQLTEVHINGSQSRPDMVEILILDSGNLAGAEIRDGIPGESCQSLVLPPTEVQAGDRILVHFKTGESEGEIDELRNKTQARAEGSSDQAWDYWIPGATGLTGTSGVVLIFEKPGGPCLDALGYSNRVSNPEDRYGGFGSRKMQEAMSWCAAQGVWKGSSQPLVPEDCVPSGGTTTLRTLCRTEGKDTDSNSDWFTSAKASLGEKNPGLAYAGRRR